MTRLPDSDDPFVVLGVSRGCDAAELRRAYARLLRIYRPDRSPAEFQRVQAAFEAARTGAATFDPPEPAPAAAADGRAGERTERALARGDADEALALLDEADAGRADKSLDRSVAMRVACAVAWSRPEAAAAIHDRYPAEEFDDYWEEIYEERRTLLEAWTRWRRRHRKPAWLPRVFELSDSLDEDDLARQIPRDPGRMRSLSRALDRMDKVEERLLYVLLRRDANLVDDTPLTPREEKTMRKLRWRIALRQDLHVALAVIGWLLAAALTSGVVLLFLLGRRRTGTRYREIVRPRLFKLARTRHLCPLRYARLLRSTARAHSVEAFHAAAIEEDLPLLAASFLLRLMRSRAAPAAG